MRLIDYEGEFNPDDVMPACLVWATRLRRAVFPTNVSAGYRDLTEEGGGSAEIGHTGIVNVGVRAAETRAACAGGGTVRLATR